MADELAALAQEWLTRIAKREKDRSEGWGADAEAAERAYAIREEGTHGKLYDFNILFSNVETIVPAVFNSMPAPDIRERFRQGDGPARVAADVLERAVSVQTDDSALDVEVEDVARDGIVAGRGILRLRFEADADGEAVSNERVEYEAVSWRDYLEAKATRFGKVPWISFRHDLDPDEVERISDKKLLDGQVTEIPSDEDKPSSVTVYEIWCKKKREVLFIRWDNGTMIKRLPDPLGLKGFFPVCKPLQPLALTGKRDPIVPFKAYRKLADELDEVTRRINAITKGLKVRGLLISGAEDIERLAQAGDNELVTASNLEGLATIGLDKAVMWWPIETAVAVLRELYISRDQTKQAIYEITGISDIVRGASESRETATAQQIKTQWGSLRIKRMQTMVERLVRDAFVMTVELVTSKFSLETLTKIVGMQIPPEVVELLQDPLMNYRIDVESDSTVRGDLSRQKSEMSEFLRGTAEFFSVMQPVVAAAPKTAGSLVALYASFARQFNLGRQAETALDELVEMAQAVAKEEPGDDNPEAQIQAQEMQAKAQEMQMKMQEIAHKAKVEEARLQAEMQKNEADNALAMAELELQREKSAADVALKGRELAIKETEAGIKSKDMHLRAAERGIRQIEVDGEPQSMGDFETGEDQVRNALGMLSQQMAGMQAAIRDGIADMGREIADGLSAPKEVVRENGQVVGVRSAPRPPRERRFDDDISESLGSMGRAIADDMTREKRVIRDGGRVTGVE